MRNPDAPEWLIFIDADAAFVEYEYNIYESFLSRLPPEVMLVVAEDIGGEMIINTGFMAVRTGHQRSRELLRLIWDKGRDLKVNYYQKKKFSSFIFSVVCSCCESGFTSRER